MRTKSIKRVKKFSLVETNVEELKNESNLIFMDAIPDANGAYDGRHWTGSDWDGTWVEPNYNEYFDELLFKFTCECPNGDGTDISAIEDLSSDGKFVGYYGKMVKKRFKKMFRISNDFYSAKRTLDNIFDSLEDGDNKVTVFININGIDLDSFSKYRMYVESMGWCSFGFMYLKDGIKKKVVG